MSLVFLCVCMCPCGGEFTSQLHSTVMWIQNVDTTERGRESVCVCVKAAKRESKQQRERESRKEREKAAQRETERERGMRKGESPESPLDIQGSRNGEEFHILCGGPGRERMKNKSPCENTPHKDALHGYEREEGRRREEIDGDCVGEGRRLTEKMRGG